MGQRSRTAAGRQRQAAERSGALLSGRLQLSLRSGCASSYHIGLYTVYLRVHYTRALCCSCTVVCERANSKKTRKGRRVWASQPNSMTLDRGRVATSAGKPHCFHQAMTKNRYSQAVSAY